MRKIIFLLFIMVWGGILPKLYGQKEMNTWILGAGKLSPTDDTVANQILCASTLNFNSTQPILGKTCKFLPSWGNHVSICDKTGQLLFYSNGSKIFNYRHLLIENADSLNEGIDQDKIGYYYRTIVVIPNPYNNSQYYFISQFFPSTVFSDNRYLTAVQYSIIDMSLNNGLGKIILREKKICTGSFAQGVFACKKANGKDWWLLVRDIDNSNGFNLISIDEKGINLVNEKQYIGYKLFSGDESDSVEIRTWGNFSHDGKRFSFGSYKGLEIFDFNRCTGTLSNARNIPAPFNDTVYGKENAEVIFSPNNQYLYSIYSNRIYQYDVTIPDFRVSQTRVATYDGFIDKINLIDGFNTNFFSACLASDGKIYIGNGTGARYLHIIQNPNGKGVLCNLQQHQFKLSGMNFVVPSFPNYSLLKDSSSCTSELTEVDDMEIEVYPNPVKEYLSIEVSEQSKIIIYDILGRILIEQNISKGISKIDLTAFQSGFVYVKVAQKNEEKSVTQKMLISR